MADRARTVAVQKFWWPVLAELREVRSLGRNDDSASWLPLDLRREFTHLVGADDQPDFPLPPGATTGGPPR